MKTKKILISGYYGFDNFGDDAILHTLLHNIKTNISNSQISVISKNPVKIKQKYNINSVYTFNYMAILKHIITSDLFISGGGSLLQDVTSFKSLIYYLSLIFLAKLFNVKTYVYAQGIGPINNKLGRVLTGFILKKVNLITVRDQQSKDFLDKLGISSILTADPVWCFEEENLDKHLILEPQKIKVGVQLRDWSLLNDQKLESIANSLKLNFADQKYQIILISLQDSKDLVIAQKLEKFLKSKNPELNVKLINKLSLFDSISLISQLDYLIAMRYHAGLVAIKYGIPTLTISYDPKVKTLSKEAEIPNIEVDTINEEELNRKIQELIDNKSEHKDKLKNYAAKKELLSRQNIDLLSKILG
jgi:polysaccharide pyruvyl transferase CsaB